MDTVVWPYLKEREEKFSIEIRGGYSYPVLHYHADEPEQVVVISHGFTETAHKYGEVIYYFLKHGYEVYIPEHCGHGESYRLVSDHCLVHVDSYERYIRDLLKAVSRAKKENPGLPLLLYGHSMGGGIAAGASGRRPEWFDRVILSSPMIVPLTGWIPWSAAKGIAAIACAFDKADDYVFGYGPYTGEETFVESASTSPARFFYYQTYRQSMQQAQMNAPSYGWIREAGRLSRELFERSCRNLPMPLLLLQAQTDHSVSNKAQERFIHLVNENGGSARMLCLPGAKHEIFNSSDEVVEIYWKSIFQF
jgi:lysophospholipase